MAYDLSTTWTIVLVVGVIWELIWKGAALWRAAQYDQPGWFTLMLVISSMGVLPIIYLLSHREHSQSSTAHRGTV